MNIFDLRQMVTTDAPFAADRELYDRAALTAVKHWVKVAPEPVSIYQIGRVGAPGISDLDFIIVYEDHVKIRPWLLSQSELPQWTHSVVTHPPYLCTLSAWSALQSWFPVFDLIHLWGQPLQAPVLDEKLAAGCAMGMLVDYFIAKIPTDIFEIAYLQPVRLRILLCMLHSVKYTVRLAKTAQITIPSNSDSLITEIDALRTGWLSLSNDDRLQQLSSLTHQTIILSGELIRAVDDAIRGSLSPSLSQPQAQESEELGYFKFRPDWDFDRACSRILESLRFGGSPSWENPSSFLFVLGHYSRRRKNFRKFLSRYNIRPPLQWDGGRWAAGLDAHIDGMIKFGDAGEKVGIHPQKYVALGYQPPMSIKKLLWNTAAQPVRLVRRLRNKKRT